MYVVKRPLSRRIASVALSVSVVWAGVPTLSAQRQDLRISRSTAINALQLSATAANIAEFKRSVETMRQSSDPEQVRRATRLDPLVRYLDAKNSAERHEAVQQLPVTIVVSRPGDARRGILKTYVINGKARGQRFIPGVAIETEGAIPRSAHQALPITNLAGKS